MDRINGDWPVVLIQQGKSTRVITKADSDAGDESDVEQVVSEVSADVLSEHAEPVWKQQVKQWGQDAYDELGVDMSFRLDNPAVKQHLANFAGERIAGINSTTQEQLRAELVEGVDAGEGIDDLSARVEKVFGYAEGYRNERIARTEVIRSSNFVNVEAYRSSGLVDNKQWIATPDDRTRDSHEELDGTVIPIDDTFKIGKDEADAPGDFGVAALDINCRCTIAPVIEDAPKSVDARNAVWKAYDKKAAEWEDLSKRAFAKAFRQQCEVVLRKLNTLSNAAS